MKFNKHEITDPLIPGIKYLGYALLCPHPTKQDFVIVRNYTSITCGYPPKKIIRTSIGLMDLVRGSKKKEEGENER